MITLALEFSSSVRSVALLLDDIQADLPVLRGSASDDGARSVTPLKLIERALAAAALGQEAIERIVVGLGPGSYTGIRSAIAVAQGWQLARQVQLIGLSSAECLAAQARANAWFGEVCVAIDAQRNEFYVGRYEILAPHWREIEPLRLASLDELDTLAQLSSVMIVGPEINRWIPQGKELLPSAAALGRLAHGRTVDVPGEKLEPIYLRQTQFVKAPPPRNWL
ncbi:MAG: tRNA (adenosine(37)-N6)-threonylcarbamoyltransferase complex dimerization subunit type 1 TsaB [Verrucomicrobia bacterium]|nr:tRNA (adenosine(37)-N6)-threonylcarbamoyltransferase complex dimerization subunit type 1 TsaB [Verrucomicrobiota bacterium]